MADKTDAPEDEEVDELEDELDAPWDQQVDPFVNEIDAITLKKYNISFRKLLISPKDFAENPDILGDIKSIKDEVGTYFDGVMDDLQTEQDELTKSMEEADALYTKLDQIIASKATVARIPYIKPVDIDFEDKAAETISVDMYDNNLDSLIAKFINVSNYVGNMSTLYKSYNVGSWLFSGGRNYIIRIDQPESMVITVENARQYIEGALDDASAFFSNASSAK